MGRTLKPVVRARRAAALALAAVLCACGPGPPRAEAGACDQALVPVPPMAGLPARVVPAGAASTDLVCALLDPGSVVALPELVSEYAAPEASTLGWARLPRFERYGAEALLALDPDLVLAHPWQSPDASARLREAGVPVLILPDPVGWPGARAQLLALGRLLGPAAAGRARALVADLDARVAALAARADGQPARCALPYTHGGAGGWTAGKGTNLDEILRLAGLVNVAAREGREGHGRLDFEQLLVLDPELILAGGETTLRVLQEVPALAGLRALRAGAVVVLPEHLYDATSFRIVAAAEQLAQQLAERGEASR